MDTALVYAQWGRQLHPAGRLVLTLGLAALVGTLRWLLSGHLQDFPFILAYPVALAAGFLFGWAYGLIMAVLGAFSVMFLLLPPVYSLEVVDPQHFAGVAAYLLGSLFMVSLVEGLVRALAQRNEAHGRTTALLREKELLLRELNHRVKNSLQAINAMLTVHRAKLSHQDARDALAAAIERVAVVGRIHDRLYQQSWQHPDEELTLNAHELLEELCAGLRFALAQDRQIRFDIDVEPIPMSVGPATTVGLVVNELVTNALKYAFPGDRSGTLTVRLWRSPNELLYLVVADDGVGCPATYADGIGLTLVEALAAQLSGTVTREDTNSGCRITLHIPAPKPVHA